MADVTQIRAFAAALGQSGDKARTAVTDLVGMAALSTIKTAQNIVVEKDIIDTGATLDSIGFDDISMGTTIAVEIGPTTEYSPFLEDGTSRMAPRPFMGPAGDAVGPSFIKGMENLGEAELL